MTQGDSVREIQQLLTQLVSVVERFSSLPLEFEARGLEGDVPVPSSVFLEALSRVSHLAVALATTQVTLSQSLVAALMRADGLREDDAARVFGLQTAVDQHSRQIQALATTLHQLTRCLSEQAGLDADRPDNVNGLT